MKIETKLSRRVRKCNFPRLHFLIEVNLILRFSHGSNFLTATFFYTHIHLPHALPEFPLVACHPFNLRIFRMRVIEIY
jgi:hypothetical protein